MARKLVAITLFVSFVAMATSGLMMFVIEKPSFTIQMHPVHKLFGLIMIAAVLAHLSFNYRSLLNYLKERKVLVLGVCLVALLVVLYGVSLFNALPPEIAIPLDDLARQAEGHD